MESGLRYALVLTWPYGIERGGSAIETELERIADLVRHEILKDFQRDSCAATARVLIEVLKARGYRATPLAVDMLVGNAAFWKQAHDLDRLPSVPEFAPGVWSVALGYGATDRAGNAGVGHVAVVVDDRFLVDAALDQVDRPDKQLVIEHLVFPLPDDYPSCVHIGAMAGRGCYAVYTPTGEHAYRLSSDWTNRRRTRPVVARVMRRLQSEGLGV